VRRDTTTQLDRESSNQKHGIAVLRSGRPNIRSKSIQLLSSQFSSTTWGGRKAFSFCRANSLPQHETVEEHSALVEPILFHNMRRSKSIQLLSSQFSSRTWDNEMLGAWYLWYKYIQTWPTDHFGPAYEYRLYGSAILNTFYFKDIVQEPLHLCVALRNMLKYLTLATYWGAISDSPLDLRVTAVTCSNGMPGC
jgi:hypothetical protein